MNLRVSRSSSPRESLVGIAVDPPLGPAERKVDERRLPGHQAGQRPGFVLVDRRVIAQPALERPPRIVVLHPIADEVADLARIELDHDFDAHLAVGSDHERADVFRQVEAVRRLIEIVVRRLEGLHRSAVPCINLIRGRADRPGPTAPIVTDHPRDPQWPWTADAPERARSAERQPADPPDTHPPHSRPSNHPSNHPRIRISDGRMRSMQPWRLEEINYGQVKSKPPFEVAVLPLGATEPHNLHLPYGTDTFQVEAIAEAGLCAWLTARGAGAAAAGTCPTAPRPTR